MKVVRSIQSSLRLLPAESRRQASGLSPSAIGNRQSAVAFTLLELLVVITILGILAGLSVPALKNIGKSNAQAGATRQMLDDVARARQLAISRHTTVYMVFVPTNFWGGLLPADFNSAATTNLFPLQLTGYNFLSYGRVGDQPGQHQWAYLSDWKSLPEGTFIPPQKFQSQNFNSLSIPQWQIDYSARIDNWIPGQLQIYGFTRVALPFPFETSPLIFMPCIAFDYQGRLISEQDAAGSYHHAYIPLAQGTVSYGRDVNKNPQPTLLSPGDISEIPPGNSTGISYNIIDINPLTGRAEPEHFKMQ